MEINSMDYLEILNKYGYASSDSIIDRIQHCDFANEVEVDDIINSIVLWKINRQVKLDKDLIIKINKLPCDRVELVDEYEFEIREILLSLLKTKGIKIAMASTILKMFKPLAFPIIDQRAYRVIYGKDFPVYYGESSYNKYVDLYIQYIKECSIFQKTNCPDIPFNKIDELLYQIDIENGNKIRY